VTVTVTWPHACVVSHAHVRCGGGLLGGDGAVGGTGARTAAAIAVVRLRNHRLAAFMRGRQTDGSASVVCAECWLVRYLTVHLKPQAKSTGARRTSPCRPPSILLPRHTRRNPSLKLAAKQHGTCKSWAVIGTPPRGRGTEKPVDESSSKQPQTQKYIVTLLTRSRQASTGISRLIHEIAYL
jgi:hypothetical protein